MLAHLKKQLRDDQSSKILHVFPWFLFDTEQGGWGTWKHALWCWHFRRFWQVMRTKAICNASLLCAASELRAARILRSIKHEVPAMIFFLKKGPARIVFKKVPAGIFSKKCQEEYLLQKVSARICFVPCCSCAQVGACHNGICTFHRYSSWTCLGKLDFKNVPKRVKFSQTSKHRTPTMSEQLNMFTKGTRAEVTPELDWRTNVARRPKRKKTRSIM